MERTKVQLFLSVEKFFQRVSLLIFVSDCIDLNLLQYHASCCIKHFIIIKAKKKNTMAFDFFRKLFSTSKRKNILFKKVFLEAINSSNI